MRRLLSLIAPLMLLPVSSAVAPPHVPAAMAVRQVMAAQAAAWNRGDIAGFMDGYWRSPQTQFIGADGITLGWTTVRDRYRSHYSTRAAMGQLAYAGIEVTLLGPDAAYVVGHYRLDRAEDHPEGVFTLLFRRLPAGWRIVSDHTTALIGAGPGATQPRHPL